MEIKSISPSQLNRVKYSVEELSEELANYVSSTGKGITLDTQNFWYAFAAISPYAFSFACTLSKGYNGDFTAEELVKELVRAGVYVSPWFGETIPGYYLISARPLKDGVCRYNGIAYDEETT